MPRTSAKRATPTTAADAIALLEADHREVEAMFKKFEKTDDDEMKVQIASDICKALTIHQIIEEEIFYPGVKDAVDEEIYTEAYVEHDGSKVLLAEIEAGSPDDEFYDAKVKVLSEMIKHHVAEEEQRNGMFAQAKRNEVDLIALGEAMAARKEELLAEFESAGLPPPETKVMRGGEIVQGAIEASQAA